MFGLAIEGMPPERLAIKKQSKISFLYFFILFMSARITLAVTRVAPIDPVQLLSHTSRR